MKKLALLTLVLVVVTGCLRVEQAVHRRIDGENPYLETPFYFRYLGNSDLDRQISTMVLQLQQNPGSAALQNELGALLLQKGFPKDAEREFRRAIYNDPEYYPAWYNLGLIRETRGDEPGAMRALRRTIDLKPGHAPAHFQLGLLLEKEGRTDAAVGHYARAFSINHALLDVRVNPRIVDTKLVDRTLLEIYPAEHSKRSVQFQPSAAGHPTAPLPAEPPLAPSRQPSATEIVTPAPPVTDPAVQTPPQTTPPPPPPTPPSASRFGAPPRNAPAPSPIAPQPVEVEQIEEEEEEDEVNEEGEVKTPPPPPPK